MASILSGPIPQHPMFSQGGQNTTTHRAPRVKPEASAFAAHGKNGTVANLFEVKGTSCFDTSSYKPKKAPVDHMTENVKRMRQIQRRCRQKQKEEESSAPVPVKALWKSHKYDAVPSKLAEFLEKEPETPTRPRSANFLRAHSRTGIPPAVPRPQSSRTPRAPRPSTPQDENRPPTLNGVGLRSRSASCSDLSATGSAVNFIRVNAMAASRQQVKRPPSQTSLEESLNIKAERYHRYKQSVKGTVPKYLEKRKEEWKQEEEDRIRNTPDPDMPPGHRVMPADERQETLRLLEQSHKDLTTKLSSLPIRSDTLRVRSAKEQLEAKLAEVEEAIKIFSRPKVFVRVDD